MIFHEMYFINIQTHRNILMERIKCYSVVKFSLKEITPSYKLNMNENIINNS